MGVIVNGFRWMRRGAVLVMLFGLMGTCSGPQVETPGPNLEPLATSASSEFPSASPTAVPEERMDYQNETYCTIGGVDLLFDLSYPDRMGTEPLPLVVYVHGGA